MKTAWSASNYSSMGTAFQLFMAQTVKIESPALVQNGISFTN